MPLLNWNNTCPKLVCTSAEHDVPSAASPRASIIAAVRHRTM
jgi:hypothetical protein